MKNKTNWPKEFELFMAQQPDYEGVPVWDRWLWWCNKDKNPIGHKEALYLLKQELFISDFAVWTRTDEGWKYWESLDSKWLTHIKTINRRSGKE
jgi:hypothetical protein